VLLHVLFDCEKSDRRKLDMPGARPSGLARDAGSHFRLSKLLVLG
jgi:hypothetical protein